MILKCYQKELYPHAETVSSHSHGSQGISSSSSSVRPFTFSLPSIFHHLSVKSPLCRSTTVSTGGFPPMTARRVPTIVFPSPKRTRTAVSPLLAQPQWTERSISFSLRWPTWHTQLLYWAARKYHTDSIRLKIQHSLSSPGDGEPRHVQICMNQWHPALVALSTREQSPPNCTASLPRLRARLGAREANHSILMDESAKVWASQYIIRGP